MKKYIFLFCSILICSNAHAEKVRVFTDYSPVRVLKMVDKNSSFEVEANKSGLKGNFKDVEEALIPKDRDSREFWTFEKGEIKIDETLKLAKASSEESKKQKKTVLIGKLKTLGLDDEDVKILNLRS